MNWVKSDLGNDLLFVQDWNSIEIHVHLFLIQEFIEKYRA